MTAATVKPRFAVFVIVGKDTIKRFRIVIQEGIVRLMLEPRDLLFITSCVASHAGLLFK